MKLRYLYYFLLITVLFGCKKKSVEIISQSPKQVIEEPFNFKKQTIYGVYQLSKDDYAICIPVQFGSPEKMDSLSEIYTEFLTKNGTPWIYDKPMGNYAYQDTLSSEKLIYNADFDKTFRTKFKSSYYIYSLSSKSEATIKKILFKSSDCGNDYIALILEFGDQTFKNPVIASVNNISLKFRRNLDAENLVNELAGKDATENMYGSDGKYSAKIFSETEDYYFSYHDDFKWYKKNYDGGIQFPERMITKIVNNKPKIIWANEMDLLGLPCL